MIKVNLGTTGSGWQTAAGSIYHALRPTGEVTMLGARYRLRSKARPRTAGDRDYAVLQTLARGKRCILDVGANVGLTSLVMSATMAADGLIYAFEASEQGCYLIRDHIALNGLNGRVQVINALITERSGHTIDFYGDAASGSASIIPGYLAHNRPLQKATLALDDFINGMDIAPELIKIDIEGAELKALAGLTRTLQTIRPLVFVELHAWGDVTVSGTAAGVLELLQPLDYDMVYLRTKEIVTDPAILADRGRCHVVLCPRESSFGEQLATLDTGGL